MDETALIRVMSGEAKGPWPTLFRLLAWIAQGLYALGVSLRNSFYDRWPGAVHRVSVPVLSVGNLTTGGTGKTPVCAELLNRLRRMGATPALLSRGYRARAGEVNDETQVLAQLCPGIRQYSGRDRVALAQQAIRDGANVLVLDDGFQHRRLARDLNLVLIDASRPFGFGYLLPRGLLREPMRALRRADGVAITRADAVSADELLRIRHSLQRWVPSERIFEIRFPVDEGLDRAGKRVSLGTLGGKPLFAFCGIGNPEGFRQTLQSHGLTVDIRIFPDHHAYDAEDLRHLAKDAKASETAAILTTRKDLVKLPEGWDPGVPVLALEQRVEIAGGEDFDRAVTDLAR